MTAAPLLAGVLPGIDTLAAAEMYDDPPELAPLPEEEPLIAKSVAKRRNEFITVRYCARQALGELGVAPVPILKGDKGEPCWPDGVVGSLTHCTGFRGAAVGRHGAVRSVGIDAEPHDVLPNGVLDAVSLPKERIELQAMPNGLHWDRILFCAKEATYKAWYPLTHRWLGFEDAHITFDVDDSGTSGGFESRILIDPAAESGPPLESLSGRWSVRDGLALTAIVLCRAGASSQARHVTSHDAGPLQAIFGTRRWASGPRDPGHPCSSRIERATKILGLLTAPQVTRDHATGPDDVDRGRRRRSLAVCFGRWPHRCADRCGGRRAAR
jgi:4'-phosphopantetheinyl transferase EntD